MAPATAATLDGVKAVLVSVLGIEDRAGTIDRSTELLGSLPELDSMAVVELVTALEQRFAVEVGDDEITGEVFESVGSLADFIEAKTA
jgi:acyl carrier protein